MHVKDWFTSLVRTYVPIAVGAVISWLASVGLDVGADAEVGLTIFLTAIVTGLYYLLARTLEAKWPAIGGVLLGSTKKPVYQEVATTAEGHGVYRSNRY